MDDFVAVCIKLKKGGVCYFLTYGRLFDAVDGSKLADIVLSHSASYALGGEPIKAEVCYSLSDASKSPYFYEALLNLVRFGPPNKTAKYKTWKRIMTKAIKNGEMIMYCGDHKHRNRCRKSFWSMNRV